MDNSFIEINNSSPFTLNNLPYGVFKTKEKASFRVGVAVGEYVLDLSELEHAGLITLETNKKNIFGQNSLNVFMGLGYDVWRSVRQQLMTLLDQTNAILRDDVDLREKTIVKRKYCQLKLPVDIPDYTDFFASEYHARNLGKIFRPNQDELAPNWKHMPIAYHGRSSSVVVSGTPIKRPQGQILDANNKPFFSASKLLDIEVELGFVIGTGNVLGYPIPVTEACKHIFGAVLVNDWSARDIQRWEYVPLGPFLGKNFATSISPWVVPMFALEEFKVAAVEQDLPILDYLQQTDQTAAAYDIDFSLALKTPAMSAYTTIAETNSKYIYWTCAQMLAHHSINGCNMRCGDLIATGTISGPDLKQAGSLIELNWAGKNPIQLSSEETRCFLENGDSIKISGVCKNAKGLSLGFGDVEGMILGNLGKCAKLS